MSAWIEYLNNRVLYRYATRLSGGHAEPFYRAPRDDQPAEVQFTLDHERSALHELGHWCIAGDARRLLDDYGYWYEPDGRSDEQQRLFFEVEVRPQAIEKHFCTALDIHFEVSTDNLTNHPRNEIDAFSARVHEQYLEYLSDGLPKRATEIFNCLLQWHRALADKSAA
jgi:elongation factor P hydroxylase